MKTTINMAVIENLLKEKGYASQSNEVRQYVKITLPNNDCWGKGTSSLRNQQEQELHSVVI